MPERGSDRDAWSLAGVPHPARGHGRRARCVDRPRGRVRATAGLRMLDALAGRGRIERRQSLLEGREEGAGAIADADGWQAKNWRTSTTSGMARRTSPFSWPARGALPTPTPIPARYV